MQPIGRGATGTSVLDVQRRLESLGYRIPMDERSGLFADGTQEAVRAFQQARGLIVDGLVGEETWRQLVEASWGLGDRVLYLRAPHLRGDDVRELQDRLATLGFDVGRVDGIFGPQTQQAVREFQRNYGLPADGIVAEGTLRALAGLPRIAGDLPIAVLREREQLRHATRTLPGMRIVLDPGHGGVDAGVVGPSGIREADVSLALARQVEAALAAAGAQVFLTRSDAASPSESDRASLANALGADVFLGLHLGGSAGVGGAVAFYFGHSRFRSESGARLAELLLEEVCPLGLTDGGTHAKTFAVLRETKMPAVVLEPGRISDPGEEKLVADGDFQARLAMAVAGAFRRFTETPQIVLL